MQRMFRYKSLFYFTVRATEMTQIINNKFNGELDMLLSHVELIFLFKYFPCFVLQHSSEQSQSDIM